MASLKQQLAEERTRLNNELEQYIKQLFGEQNQYRIDVKVSDIDLSEEIRVSLTSQTGTEREVTNQRFTIIRNTQKDEQGRLQPNYILKADANAQGYDKDTETTVLKTMPAQISIQVINVIIQVIEQFVTGNSEPEDPDSESAENAENIEQ